jgi:hypothetical protein
MFDPETSENLEQGPEPRPFRLEGAEREAAMKGAVPRYVNAFLVAGEGSLPQEKSLVMRREYTLRVNIGQYDSKSIVRNAIRRPWPGEYLPQSVDGHWLQIVASSDDFKIHPQVRRMFLPLHGQAWACDCPSSARHRCKKATRRGEVDFTILSPARPRRATLRLTVYYELNAIQSLLVTANVGRKGGVHCSIDFSLTAHLAGIGELRPRALNIVTNDSPTGSHSLHVNSRDQEPFICTLSDDEIGTSVSSAREYLLGAHIETGRKERLAYGSRNEKPRDAFIDDLRRLASIGWDLLTGAFPYVDKRDRLIATLREASAKEKGEAVIQIARSYGSTLAFPWYLVYDIPFSAGAPPIYCPYLTTWDPESSKPEELEPRCPQVDSHDENVLCPYGFWGFAHIIELLPFVDVELPHCDSIRTQPSDAPIAVAIGVSPDLDDDLTKEHMSGLETLYGGFTPASTSVDILKALGDDMDIAYFYCHGETEYRPDNEPIGPLLRFRKGDFIRPGDIYAKSSKRGAWPKDHWQRTRPLVFINGCHTTDLRPEILSNFVKAFVGSRAAGVIGTEVSIHQQVANEAAQELLRRIRVDQGTVGQAIQQMRRVLLAKGNVMGLAYNAYCFEGLSVQPRKGATEGGTGDREF